MYEQELWVSLASQILQWLAEIIAVSLVMIPPSLMFQDDWVCLLQQPARLALLLPLLPLDRMPEGLHVAKASLYSRALACNART